MRSLSERPRLCVSRTKEAETRRNAPPPPIHYSSFTEREFVEGLAKVCRPHRDDPDKVAEEFLGFCEPILHASSAFALVGALFSQSTLYSNLKRIPRPFRELMAAYQAWGLVSSNGFGSYLNDTNKKFDAEVDRGLALLGQNSVIGIVAEARQSPQDNDGDLLKEVEDALEKRSTEAAKQTVRFGGGSVGQDTPGVVAVKPLPPPVVRATPSPVKPDAPVTAATTAVPVAAVDFLKVHNDARAKVGVPPLRWSAALARYAQQWADQ